ncbi:MAG: sulfur oxidation c-type cytochrome SoxX [Pseudomonadota bacterium]
MRAMLIAAALATPAAAQVADYRIVDGAIPEPLTDVPGDPARGAAIFADREGAHCLLCHGVDSLDAPFQGDLGPDLSGYGAVMDKEVTRLRLVDATRLNPDTIMPAYHRIERLREVQARYRGRPVLSAQEIEDVIAYLDSLRPDSRGGSE